MEEGYTGGHAHGRPCSPWGVSREPAMNTGCYSLEVRRRHCYGGIRAVGSLGSLVQLGSDPGQPGGEVGRVGRVAVLARVVRCIGRLVGVLGFFQVGHRITALDNRALADKPIVCACQYAARLGLGDVSVIRALPTLHARAPWPTAVGL